MRAHNTRKCVQNNNHIAKLDALRPAGEHLTVGDLYNKQRDGDHTQYYVDSPFPMQQWISVKQ